MFPSSSFTKPSSRSAVIGGAGGTTVGSGGGHLIGSTVSPNSAVADEYEDLIKRLSLEIEATSQNICELQVRRQQLLEQLDEVKKAHHQIMEQRSHWRLALSFGSEGNEIGQLCRPWGVAIVRMPPSLLSQYLNDDSSFTSSNSGYYSSLPGCPSSTSTTGLISSSPSPSTNHNHHHQSNHRSTDSVVVGSGRGGNTGGNGGNSLTKTTAIHTGNSSSSATNMFRDNLNSASGSSSSSSSFELEFSLFSQYLNVDELAFLPSHHLPSTSSVYTGNTASSTVCSNAITSSNDNDIIGEPNTGTSSTGHAAAASITGISSSHHAHSRQHLSTYGSDNININPTSLLSSYRSESLGRLKTPQYLPYLNTLSSSSNHCDSSSSSTHNSITANLKNSITGNLSSYASTLHDNFESANGSSSPSSLWDINPLSTTKSSASNPSSLINGNRNGYKSTNNSVNNATGDVTHKHYLIAIADRSNNRIQLLHFDATAMTIKVVHVFGSGPGTRAGLFDRPAGIAINTSLSHIIVADKDNHRVQVFDLKGRYLFKFGEKGNRVGQFCYPWDVDSCPSSHQLLVSDTRNRRVQMFSPYGQYVAHFSHPLDSPRGVSFLGDSKIVVSDFNKHRLLIFDKFHTKEDASKVIGFGEGTGWGQFLRPQGISIAGNNIFCADSRNNRICIYNLLTQGFEYLSQDLNCDRPSGLHVVDNILVVVDFGNNRLQICLRH